MPTEAPRPALWPGALVQMRPCRCHRCSPCRARSGRRAPLTGSAANGTIKMVGARPADRVPRRIRGQSGAEVWCDTTGTREGLAFSRSSGATWRRGPAGRRAQTESLSRCKGRCACGRGRPFSSGPSPFWTHRRYAPKQIAFVSRPETSARRRPRGTTSSGRGYGD